VTHVFKYFPQIIAGYDDGKDEAEKKELLEELELEEADLKENEDKRAQAKAVQNSKKEKHYAGKRPDIVKRVEKIKAKIAALTKRIELKTRNQIRSVTPTRNKRSREEDGSSKSPAKKLRTAKKIPLSSPAGTPPLQARA
jgi:hypothetical protein